MSSNAQYQTAGTSLTNPALYNCNVDFGKNIVSLLQNLGATLPSGYRTLAYNPITGVLGYFGT
jgi:hypothetical protein